MSVVIESLNSRLRNSGLSAKEILLQRDQNTGEKFTFNDKELSFQQHNIRLQNHFPSSLSKGRGGNRAEKAAIKAGDLVYIKSEGNKFKGREHYIVTKIINDFAFLQKITFSKFMSKQYRVHLNQIYPVMPLYSNNSIRPNISSSCYDDLDDHIEVVGSVSA